MKFWDTSAVVPLLLEQEASAAVRAVLTGDSHMVAWWGTAVECASAAARLRREERLTPAEEDQVLDVLARLRESWYEVQPSTELRADAMRLVRVHSLRAADALQLAAARLWAGSAADAAIVTFDERLALAARLEGFRLLP
jgi:uncharacterized protein